MIYDIQKTLENVSNNSYSYNVTIVEITRTRPVMIKGDIFEQSSYNSDIAVLDGYGQ